MARKRNENTSTVFLQGSVELVNLNIKLQRLYLQHADAMRKSLKTNVLNG